MNNKKLLENKIRKMVKEEINSKYHYSDELRSAYYAIGDAKRTILQELEKAGDAENLKLFKQMYKFFDKSNLGRIL